MEFAWDCAWCDIENWVYCEDVGFWRAGSKYRAPDTFTCWLCGEETNPVFD